MTCQPRQPAAMPGDVRQIGYVVRNLDQAIKSWLDVGVGPFYVLRDQQQHALYRGQPAEVTLSVAFANTGDLQIELICQHDDTPSIFTEFLESGHDGFHQLAWWATDFDAALRAAQDSGLPVVWSGGEDGGTRFAYLEPMAGPATIFEIMELTDATNGMATLVRDAADGWDGDDPIRVLGG